MTWLVVDAMNVVGSRPDGWWHDRRGALLDLVADVHAASHALAADRITVVCDGRGEDEPPGPDGVEVVWAGTGPDAADDRIVELLAPAPRGVTVVTADRGLRDRVLALHADVEGPRSFRRRLGPGAP